MQLNFLHKAGNSLLLCLWKFRLEHCNIIIQIDAELPASFDLKALCWLHGIRMATNPNMLNNMKPKSLAALLV